MEEGWGCYRSPLARGALEEDLLFPKGIFLFVVARLSSSSSSRSGAGTGTGTGTGTNTSVGVGTGTGAGAGISTYLLDPM